MVLLSILSGGFIVEKIRLCLALAGFMLFLAGCATIVASGPDWVPVNSTPSGATVYLDNVPVGVTPTTLALKRSSLGQIRIELPGYQPIHLSQAKVFNGWFVGNIALGGLIGIIVDVAASNVTKYSENAVMVYLQAVDENGNKSDPVAINLVPITD